MLQFDEYKVRLNNLAPVLEELGQALDLESAERELGNTDTLYCLGDIVHNSLEVERLEHMGLHTIDHEGLSRLRDRKVLLRAHGEPPSTYALAKRNNITIIGCLAFAAQDP
mgnify:CR=1 FL=1